MTRLKLCGMTNGDDIRFCCRAGTDIIGLVAEYPRSVPWNLTSREAASLLPYVEKPAKSCLVTGGSIVHILSLADTLQPDMIQLHGGESLTDTAALADALAERGIETVKALPVRPDGLCELEGVPSLKTAVAFLNDTAVSMLLIDSRAPSSPAASGQIDAALYQQAALLSRKPVMLAGGLTPQNLADRLAALHPYGVDILTGVETAPRVKSREAIETVCRIRREYDKTAGSDAG